MHYVYLTCPVLLSSTKIFHAGIHIIRIVIPHLQKQMCIKTVAKTGLLLKIRQSKSFVIKRSDILITDNSSYSMLLPVAPLRQLEKYMSAVILPGFHFKVAQWGIYSKTMTFITLLWKNCIQSLLSRKTQVLSDWSKGRKQFAYLHNTMKTLKYKLLTM